MTDLSHLTRPGAEIAVRVTPKAARNAIVVADGAIRVYVTAVPEGGKANAAVVKLLAKALGVAKSCLVLIRGDTARDKVFRIDIQARRTGCDRRVSPARTAVHRAAGTRRNGG